jgi:hypothetical protein
MAPGEPVTRATRMRLGVQINTIHPPDMKISLHQSCVC